MTLTQCFKFFLSLVFNGFVSVYGCRQYVALSNMKCNNVQQSGPYHKKRMLKNRSSGWETCERKILRGREKKEKEIDWWKKFETWWLSKPRGREKENKTKKYW